ncbi:MAG TPA: hypothetical protein VGK27_03095 [Candidatus Deferrimicrobiaceae bacterium]|jgi:N-dimethylarginine dimethylaminohydrolase
MRRILMCPPDHFGIEYEINPWMSRSRGVNASEARHQWESLFDLLKSRLGFAISVLPPEPGLPDLVFTANAGLVKDGLFIPAVFRHKERQGESAVFRRWFEAQGYEVRPLPADFHFEGEGDFLRAGPNLFAGYRIRTDIRAHAMVGDILGERVLSVELTDPRFYHLDTCFCPLAPDSAIWHPPAFDRYARAVFEAHVPNLIEVALPDAMRFACNAVVDGKKIVLNTGCGRLGSTLSAGGYEVVETPLSEFIKAGGAAKCLVLFLD